MFALILSLVLLGSFSEENNFDYEILATGSFFEGEIESQNGEVWLALLQINEMFELRAVELIIEPEHSLIDDTDGDKTGTRVSVLGGEGTLLFLLRSQNNIFSEGAVYPEIVDSGNLEIGISMSVGEDNEITTTTEGLFYTDGIIVQRLSNVYPDSHGEGVSIVWAGDIDGDGKVDIILDDQPHYAFKQYYRLFLSSEATEDELVKEVAQFVTVSC